MNTDQRFRCCFPSKILFALAIGLLTALVSNAAENLQPIFDGKTLDGWVQRGGKARYTVEDGCIVGTSVAESGNSFLCTTQSYGDFILELELNAHTNLNSGIQIRSHCFDYPTNFVWDGKTNTIPAGRVHGYQIEVDNRPERRWSGGFYEEGRRGWLQSPTNNPAGQAAYKFGEWNKYRIECVGDSFKTWINGVPVTDATDTAASSGFIALQVHGTDKAGLQVRFRNIQIQEKAK
jgi:Domain of Unknown Function (DUF1080)